MTRSSKKEPDEVVDDLNPTEDGEASEEAHCSSDEAQLSFNCHLHTDSVMIIVYIFSHLHIPFDLIVGRSIKVDVYSLQKSMFYCSI